MTEISSATTPDGVKPATVAERINSLDFIRGIAVMGILAANIVAFGQPMNAYLFPEAFMVPSGDPEGWLWITQLVLVDGKMRGLFTLLFGAGLYLFMERAWARGATRWLQARRLGFLLIFGLIHYYLIWFGDILSYYAMIGLVVLLCLKWSAKWQLRIGILGYLLGAVFFALAMVFPYAIAEGPIGEQTEFADEREGMLQGKADMLADDRVEAALYQSGDYLGLVTHRVNEHGLDPFTNVLLFGLETLPLMLIGMAIYRMGFFNGGIERRSLLRWGWIGVIVGVAAHIVIGLWVKSIGFSFYGTIAGLMGMTVLPRLFMVLGLAALMVAYSPGWTGWLADRIRAAGRAAFTNYLGTSILMMFVFQGWALGLFGELNRPQLYLVTFLTWIIMLAWSKPWLERYRYGPLEWLWRCLTYGKLFPLKR